MEITPKDYCIFIASHMSKPHRIIYLIECLKSLISQTMPIPIYLSISFENNDVENLCKNEFNNHTFIINCGFLNVCVRPEKHSQMKHFQLLSNEIGSAHKWVMFSDDDDTYEPNRTLHFAQYLINAQNQLTNNNELHLAGLYESTFNKTHREHRHEYWCYCVNIDIIRNFMHIVNKYSNVIDDKCCDVLFGEHFRRKSNNYIFIQVPVKYYNYRVENNEDSVTGFIQSNQHKYTITSTPPPIESSEWSDYVFGWNDFLKENIHIYLHDTYLKSLIGMDIHRILQTEFLANFSLLNFVDREHTDNLFNLHQKIRNLCNELYDIKF